MNKWELIAYASLASLFLRAAPVIVFRNLRIAENGATYKYLNYAAAAVMGGIIYSALYGNAPPPLDTASLSKLPFIVLSFVVAAVSRGIFKTLAVCLGGYALLLACVF